MGTGIPSTWETSTLGAVAHGFVSGGTPSTKNEAFWKGPIPWITSKWLNSGLYLDSGEKFISPDAVTRSATTIVPSNNLIFATRVGVGKVAANRIDLAINQDLAGVLIDARNYDVRFIAYQLRSERIQNAVASHKRGATIQGITRENLKDLELFIPPLAEQRKIASLLEIVQRAIGQQERLVALTAELKKTLLQRLFTHGLRGESSKDTAIGPLPKSWEVEELGKVVNLFGGYAFKSEESILASNTQLVRMGNLYQNKLDLTRNPIFYPDDFIQKHPRFVLKSGDLIMSLTGTSGKEDYGFTVELKSTPRTLLLNQRIARIDLISTKLIKDFLFYFLLSRKFLDHLYPTAKGMKQANLSTHAMKRLKVPVPNIEEQKEIVSYFRSIDRETEFHQKRIDLLTDLFRTLLHQLMTAELRVEELDLVELEAATAE
jgi:type I restriction enzyme, S subunit